MIKDSVVIAALARNCNAALLRNIPLVEQLRRRFARSRVVVVENDSKDGTKQTLAQWMADSPGVTALMSDTGTATIPEASAATPYPGTSLHRIWKMARYRNIYMDWVRAQAEQPDYLIVFDIDTAGFSVAGVADAIRSAPGDWCGLFADGQIRFKGSLPYYYDMFAFVPLGGYASRKNDELYFESRRVNRLLRRTPYLPCLSAFSGLGVYKWSAVRGLNYEALPNIRSRTMEAVCEHIPFNMAAAGSKYVCRDMRLNYGNLRTAKHLALYSLVPAWLFGRLYRLVEGKKFED